VATSAITSLTGILGLTADVSVEPNIRSQRVPDFARNRRHMPLDDGAPRREHSDQAMLKPLGSIPE
jgi:hypothetical protein